MSVGVDLSGVWRNKKNGKDYLIISDHVIDANNESPHPGDQVLYMECANVSQGGMWFIRSVSEFLVKFVKV